MSSQSSNDCTDLRVFSLIISVLQYVLYLNELLWLHAHVYKQNPYHDQSWIFKSNIHFCLLLNYCHNINKSNLLLTNLKWNCKAVSLNSNVKDTDRITLQRRLHILVQVICYFFFCSTPTWSISATQTLVRMQLIWCGMLHVWKHSTMQGSRALKRKYHQIQGNFMPISP